MSRHRFEELVSQISFSAIEHAPNYDCWIEVEGFVRAINEHRHANFTPASSICDDESVSRWYGLGGDWSKIGLPHYVQLDRKPESGCELKIACCGESGIMLTVEVTKSAEETMAKDYEDDNQHGTATIFRLVEPWFGTNRLVCADSFFASVSTAIKLWDFGLRFSGVIKTATRLYPMSYMSSLEMSRKGANVSLKSGSSSDLPGLLAVCWTDRDRRYLIGSAGTTTAGTPMYRERYRTVNDCAIKQSFEIPIPSVCEQYFRVCSRIDQHNRCRQDDLNLEKKFRTQSSSTRVNSSLLAIIVVDAWLLYKGSCSTQYCTTPWNFYEELANGLLDNSNDRHALRKRPSSDGTEEAPSRTFLTGTGIHLIPTSRKRRRMDGTLTNIAYQARCCVCGKKTRRYCSECMERDGKEVFVCDVDKPACFDSHLRGAHFCE